MLAARNKASHTYFEEVEAEVQRKEEYLGDQVQKVQNLLHSRNALLEQRAVLLKGNELLGQSFF